MICGDGHKPLSLRYCVDRTWKGRNGGTFVCPYEFVCSECTQTGQKTRFPTYMTEDRSFDAEVHVRPK
jgi:hypothetical protein